MNVTFRIMFFIIPLISIAIFIFTLIAVFSPKVRGKIMSNQVKASKYMLDSVKDDLEAMGTTIGNVGVNVKKNILDENEDTLKDLSNRSANISKDAVKTTAEAVKEGFTGVSYCKYCGKNIDSDSKFCKHCGKEL